MSKKIAIHETAFVTSAFRAADKDLSKDMYAHLWPGEITEKHAEDYAGKVSEHEPFAHCLRNRYFFETLQDLVAINEIEYLINFGCGFSMYPFILSKNLKHIEVDKSDVIAFKKDRISNWMTQEILPYREIHYIAADFNNENFDELRTKITTILKGASSFILIEGVLFFLGKDDTLRLFNLFNSIQQPNDYIGSVSFRPRLEQTMVFQKLISFVEGNLDKNAQFNYQTIPDEYYSTLENYSLTDHQHTLNLARKYAPDTNIEPSEVLNEHMYILKKRK